MRKSETDETPTQELIPRCSGPPWLTRNVRVLSAVSFLQDTASELLYPLLPIYLTAVLGAPPSVVGAIEGAAEGAASLTKLAAGPLGDRFARRPLIADRLRDGGARQGDGRGGRAWPGVLAGRVVDRLGKGVRGAPRDALLVDRRRRRPPGAGCSDSTARWTPSAPSWVRCWAWRATSCSATRLRRCCGWPSCPPC